MAAVAGGAIGAERMTNLPSFGSGGNIGVAPIDSLVIETPPASTTYKKSPSGISTASSTSLPPPLPSGIKRNASAAAKRTNICVCVRVRPMDTGSSAPAAPTSPKRSPRLSTNTNRKNCSSSSSLSLRSNSSFDSDASGSSSQSASGGGKVKVGSGRLQPPSSVRTRDGLSKFRGKNTSRLSLATAPDSPTKTLSVETPSSPRAITATPAWLVTTDGTNTIYQAPSTTTNIPSDNSAKTKKTSYSFDKVYGPDSKTFSLYEQSVKDIVQSSMEGYHGSVFAYGQTSTGKTYTMAGTDQEPGIVPLAVNDCFSFIQNQKSNNREFLLRVSYMEIYNEMINDLLAPEKSPATQAIRIFESKNEGVIVRGLREEIVTSPDDVFALLSLGEARRQVGSTNLNKQSSRSHSIFRLIIESRERRRLFPPSRAPSYNDASSECSNDTPSDTNSFFNDTSGPVRLSSLSLVDLAGSESVKATGSTGARQKEGQYINKSLMTLGHVVWKLSELSAKNDDDSISTPASSQHLHIPYRDSKLTRLLQPSLRGNAQICIICTISPMSRNLEESHNTLKFASRAKRIKQSAVVTEVVDDKSLLQNYREEIEDLKRQLKEAKEAAAANPATPAPSNGINSDNFNENAMMLSNNGGGAMRSQQSQSEMDMMLVSPKANSPSVNTDATAPTVSTEQDEDTTVLVAAIKNLEHLILKTTSFPSNKKGRRKKSKSPKKQGGATARLTNTKDLQNISPTMRISKKHKRKSLKTGGSVATGSYFPSTKGTVRVMVASSDDESGDDDNDDSSSDHEHGSNLLSPVPKKELDATDFAGTEGDDEREKPKISTDPSTVIESGKESIIADAELTEEESASNDVGTHQIDTLNTPLPQSLPQNEVDEDDEDDYNCTTDNTTEDDDHDSSLVTELHRIQALLGSVLEKKTGFPSSVRKITAGGASLPVTPMTNGTGKMNGRNAFLTPQRDVEVEKLRSQLHAQELATSLRKADSSFLESQLAQKDSLLKEVSKILESVEKRQVELEHENAKMKMQLIRASKALRKRDVEIASLKKQVELNDEDMLTNL